MKTLREYINLVEAGETQKLFYPKNQTKPELQKLPGTLNQTKPELQYAFPGNPAPQEFTKTWPEEWRKPSEPQTPELKQIAPAPKDAGPQDLWGPQERPGLAPGGDPRVWDWQNELKKKGAPITVDGFYGPQTEKFGKQYGIPAPKGAQKLPPVVKPSPQATTPQQPPATAPETPTDGGLRTQVIPGANIPGSQEELDFYKKRGLTPPTEPGGQPGRIDNQPQQPAVPAAPTPSAPDGSMTFDQAFGDARRKGETTFTWRGKTYSTDLAKPKVAPTPSPDKTLDNQIIGPRSKRSDEPVNTKPGYDKSMYETADDQLLQRMLTIAKLR